MIDVKVLKELAPQLFNVDRIVLFHGFPAGGEHEAALYRDIQTIFPPAISSRFVAFRPAVRVAFGSVHSKALLTFYVDAGCRVLIHTANDYSTPDRTCDGAWHRDFPRAPSISSEFQTSLVHYLTELGAASGENGGEVMRNEIIPEVQEYDFSSAGCALVASAPGRYEGSAKDRFGLWRMRSLLEAEEAIDEDGPAAVVMQFSSLGSFSQSFLEDDVMPALFASGQRSREDVKVKPTDKLQLILPTLDEVIDSYMGRAIGKRRLVLVFLT